MNWIYLAKNGHDEYVNMLAMGSGCATTPLESWQYEHSQDPLVLRGIMKHKIIKRCWADGRPFRYMDSGYFGNRPSPANPSGWKMYHRIVLNDLQHNTVVDRPDDRWQALGLQIKPMRNSGSKILIAAPDEKPCAFYGITLNNWLESTMHTLKLHTDRPIEIRQRPASRVDRKTQTDWLHDVHALVTFNSVAATESVLAGVPVFVTAPSNAALPVSDTDLTKIETPFLPSDSQRQAWANHLAYGQFHIKELMNGTAAEILKQTKEITNV